MHSNLQPWQILLAALAGWVNRHQQHIIEYLQEENRVLKTQLGGHRLRLTDNQRRRLAVKGKAVGFKLLSEVATLVTPDTIMAWHRKLIAMKWDYNSRRKAVGRPRVMKKITELVVRMARENPRWGYSRIRGALANLGHRVAFSVESGSAACYGTTIGRQLRPSGSTISGNLLEKGSGIDESICTCVGIRGILTRTAPSPLHLPHGCTFGRSSIRTLR